MLLLCRFQRLAPFIVKMTTPAVKRGRAEDNTPPKALSMPGDICNHCKKKCTTKGKGSEAAQCDICFSWVHTACEGLSKEQYKLLAEVTKSIPNLVYCCKLNGCETRFKQLVRNTDVSTNSVDSITVNLQQGHELVSRKLQETASKIEELSACLVALSSKVEALAHDQSKSDKSVPTTKPPSHPPPSTGAAEAINVIREYSERERRKCNVVVYNLSESDEDSDAFAHVCKEGLRLNIKIVKVLRLGRSASNKARPLLVTVTDLEEKLLILRNAHNLHRHKDFSNMFISPDRTRQERDTFRMLRDELKRRKLSGETNLVIRNNKIVVLSKPVNNNPGPVTTAHTSAPPTQIQAMDQSLLITFATPPPSNNCS